MKKIFLLYFTILLSPVFGQESLNMNLLNTWNDPSIPPTSAFNNPYNEVWGYEANGHEYAIVGSTMGTHILEITDINNVVEVDFVPEPLKVQELFIAICTTMPGIYTWYARKAKAPCKLRI